MRWQFMRDNWLSNRIFKSYEDIVALIWAVLPADNPVHRRVGAGLDNLAKFFHLDIAWNNLIDQPWKIMSLGMRKWAHGF